LLDPARGLGLRYAELLERVDGAAEAVLEAGVRPGDRVAVVLSNSVESVIGILALHRAQAVPALLNPRLKPAELAALALRGGMTTALVGAGSPCAAHLEQEGGCRRVLVVDDLAAPRRATTAPGRLGALGTVRADQPGYIFYTSGTTGMPKGAVVPQGAAESRVLFMAAQAGYRHGTHNRILGLMPLYHVVGFFAVLVMALAFNGTYVVVGEFEPVKVLHWIDEHQVTGIFATPTHLDALVAAQKQVGARLSSVQHVTFAGATMPDSVLAQVRRHLPGEKVNIYGTTEAMNSLYMREPSSGAVLQPGFYSEVRVGRIGGAPADCVAPGEEGELLVSAAADATFSEYLNQPEATAEKLQSGWYRTSDAVVQQADGTIRILGRVDDMIISGGENIHPAEVERALSAHPAVADVAVVGVADDRWGQVVTACVVPRPGHAPTAPELDAFCKAGDLAHFKRPKNYVFLDQLPRNAMNKVLRKQLADAASRHHRPET
jgi:acyl-CoA synthetase (AMP-forming)/AMP-acid ligase II